MVGGGAWSGDERDGRLVGFVSGGDADGRGSAPAVVSESPVSGSLPGSAPKQGSCSVAFASPGGEGRAAAFDDDGVALGRKLAVCCIKMDMGCNCREGLGLQVDPGVEFHGSRMEGATVNMVLGSSHGPLMEEADDSHGPGSGLDLHLGCGLPHGLHGIAQPLHGMPVGGLGVLHKDSVHGGPGFVLPESVGVHSSGTSFAAVLMGRSSGLGGGNRARRPHQRRRHHQQTVHREDRGSSTAATWVAMNGAGFGRHSLELKTLGTSNLAGKGATSAEHDSPTPSTKATPSTDGAREDRGGSTTTTRVVVNGGGFGRHSLKLKTLGTSNLAGKGRRLRLAGDVGDHRLGMLLLLGWGWIACLFSLPSVLELGVGMLCVVGEEYIVQGNSCTQGNIYIMRIN
ncbi:hypothetical protein Dimus_037218 [Dionaea muscipula]